MVNILIIIDTKIEQQNEDQVSNSKSNLKTDSVEISQENLATKIGLFLETKSSKLVLR